MYKKLLMTSQFYNGI